MTQALLLIVGLVSAFVLALSYYWSNKVLKFLTVALFVFLANAIYFTFEDVKGWPTEETSEVKGILASVTIVNPSDTEGGGIYISLFPTTPQEWYEYQYHRYAPRIFYVEYSNDRAAEFEKAKQAMAEGKEVRINGIPPKNSNGNGDQEGEVAEESLGGIVMNTLERLLSPQRDTYKPNVPDVEIIAPQVPPQKGTN